MVQAKVTTKVTTELISRVYVISSRNMDEIGKKHPKWSTGGFT